METPTTGVRIISMNDKAKMEDLLYCIDFYAPVESDTAKLKVMSVDDWKKINYKTISTIWQWVDNSVFYHVSN